MAATTATSTTSRRNNNVAHRPSILACIECRRKHVKCDTTSPPCTRCTERQLVCTYKPSRRGYRAPSSNILIDSPQSAQAELEAQRPINGCSTVQSNSSAACLSSTIVSQRPNGADTSYFNSMQTGSTSLLSQGTLSLLAPIDSPSASQGLTRHNEEHLVNLYYSYFHPYHPILLPQSRYKSQGYPAHVKLVIQLIGSQYMPSISSDSLQHAVETALSGVLERSAYAVQSLLLYTICLHAQAEGAKALAVLAKAVDMAIELGLNRVDFASAKSAQDSLLEESLRRTWWELYVIDGYFAALHRQVTFKCSTVELAAYLPCEESEYYEERMLEQKQGCTLDQFDSRFFSETELRFASACYRIEAIRIMGRVLAVSNGSTSGPDDVQAVDNALAAWKLHLPDSKQGIIDCFGEVDHMILEAYTFIYSASILLHFPRSEFPLTIPTAADIACAARMTQASPTSTQHATKAISASKEISDLASLPIDKHSPLFICGLVFGCIVQLSACYVHPHACLVQHHDRVALMTGMLKAMGRQWALANDVSRHLNKIAGGVFKPIGRTSPVTSGTSPTSHDSGVDINTIPDPMSWFDLFATGDAGTQDALYGELWEPQ